MKLKRLLYFVPIIGFFVASQLDAAGLLNRFFGGSKSSSPVKSDRSSSKESRTEIQSKGAEVAPSHTPLQRRDSYHPTKGREDLKPISPQQTSQASSPAKSDRPPLPPRPAADRPTSSLKTQEEVAPKTGQERLSEIKEKRREIKSKKPTAEQQKALDAEAFEQSFGRARGAQSAREKYGNEFKEIDKIRAEDKALKQEKKTIKKEMRQEKIEGFKGKIFGKKTETSKPKEKTDERDSKHESEKLEKTSKTGQEKKVKPARDMTLGLSQMRGYDVDSRVEEIKNLPKSQQLAAAKKELKKLEKDKTTSSALQAELLHDKTEADMRLKDRNPNLYSAYANHVIDANKVWYGQGRIEEIKKNPLIEESKKSEMIAPIAKKLEEDKKDLKAKKKAMKEEFGKKEVASFKKEWDGIDKKRLELEKLGEEVRSRPDKMRVLVRSLENETEWKAGTHGEKKHDVAIGNKRETSIKIAP